MADGGQARHATVARDVAALALRRRGRTVEEVSQLILVRHGRTALNADGRLQGRVDAPLDDVGVAQAEAVAARLDLAPDTRVITSPLLRARQTAAIVCPVAVPEVDDRWIELDYGQFDGVPMADVPADVWARWRSDVDFTPPGSDESLRTLGVRVRDACEALEGDVVVVTHVSPMKAAIAWALGVGDEVSWRMQVAHASVCRIGVTSWGRQLLSLNEQA